MITSLILASQLTVFCEEPRDFAELVMTAPEFGEVIYKMCLENTDEHD